MGTLLIRNGRVLDPSRNLDEVRDLAIHAFSHEPQIGNG